MSQDPEYLISGWASGSLSEREQHMLAITALSDQDLFNQLIVEEYWRRILDIPGFRTELYEALCSADRPQEPEQEKLTLHLSGDLRQALADAVGRLHLPEAEVVHMALCQFLNFPRRDGRAPADRVRNLIGSLDSGTPDLAENHRSYILAALEDGD